GRFGGGAQLHADDPAVDGVGAVSPAVGDGDVDGPPERKGALLTVARAPPLSSLPSWPEVVNALLLVSRTSMGNGPRSGKKTRPKASTSMSLALRLRGGVSRPDRRPTSMIRRTAGSGKQKTVRSGRLVLADQGPAEGPKTTPSTTADFLQPNPG